MIKCNRCGKMSVAGAIYCQTCGTPLSSKVDQGVPPKSGSQEQPELPAWLESLRAGERSAPLAQNPANFSAADFIEEGSLPSWMRAERNEGRENTASHPPVPFQSSGSFPVPGESALPPQGIDAQSLIDEKALPSWMQQGSGQLPTPPTQGGPLSASSLVQPDAVPDWMKSLQQSAPPSSPSYNPVPPLQSAEPISPPPSQGFSARDLVDQQALPSWMAQLGGQTPPVSGNNEQPAAPQPATSGFSASSLLDEASLPQWLREGRHEQEKSNPALPASSTWQTPTPSAPSWQTPPQSNQSWQAPAPMQTPPQAPSPQGNNLSASSFIDMNALPEWLRSSGESNSGMHTPASQPMPTAPRPGTFPVPPHVDTVRVPNRPRSEINPNGESEIAANVFASMLGVASAAPNYPSPPAGTPYQQPAYQPPLQPNQPGQLPPMGTPGMGGNVPNTPSGIMRPQAPGYASGTYGQSPINAQNYPMGTPMTNPAQTPGGPAGMPPSPQPLWGNDGARNNGSAKPAKRSFLDIIRGWFEH